LSARIRSAAASTLASPACVARADVDSALEAVDLVPVDLRRVPALDFVERLLDRDDVDRLVDLLGWVMDNLPWAGDGRTLARRARSLASASVDAYLAIASKREVRSYADRALADDSARRILDAGRIAGSSRNRQPWRFLVLGEKTPAAAETVHNPSNVRGAALVVAIVVRGKGPLAFDAGRAAQNMMLAAWNEGIGSSPNGVADHDALSRLLGLADDERAVILLSFGSPARPVDPARRSAEEWIERADRKPFDEVVQRA
jgi:nitroreductase